MSLWLDSEETSRPVSTTMADLVFRIECQRLPVDHANALASSIVETLPILAQSPYAGIHPIHVAGSQNGWERPDRDDSELWLSRRTRLRLRVARKDSAEFLSTLAGTTLSIAGYPLKILSGTERSIEPAQSLFSRYTSFKGLDSQADETIFVNAVLAECKALGYQPNKILCGKSQSVQTDEGRIITRSVLIADIPPADSITLQERGLGERRTIGCGLMLPHKDTNAVAAAPDS